MLQGPGASLARAEEWTLVTATGRYADRNLMLVRNRPNHGVFGYEVAIPLELADGASLLVDRGWIPNGRTAADPPPVPATPAGDITVTGWLRVGEPSLGQQLVRPQALAAPDTDQGPHLAYALQWWLASPVGLVMVFVGARREFIEGSGSTQPVPGSSSASPVPANARKIRIWDEEDE